MLSKVKVFVPVSVEEKPENNTGQIGVTVNCIYDNGTHGYCTFYDDGFISFDKQQGKVVSWLKECDMYCFSKEELEKFAIKIFEDAQAVDFIGRDKKFTDDIVFPDDFKNVDRKEYINQLIK